MACDTCVRKTKQQLYQAATRAGFSQRSQSGADHASIATFIAMAESGDGTTYGCASCYNGTAVGAWQINKNHAGEIPGAPRGTGDFIHWLRDTNNNARAAKWVYDHQGWDAWVVVSNGQVSTDEGDPDQPRPGYEPPNIPGTDTNPTDIFGGIDDAVMALGQVANYLNKASQWLTDPDNTLRIVQVLAGGALIAIAANTLIKPVLLDQIKAIKPI